MLPVTSTSPLSTADAAPSGLPGAPRLSNANSPGVRSRSSLQAEPSLGDALHADPARTGSAQATDEDGDGDEDDGAQALRALAALKYQLAETSAADLAQVLSCLEQLGWQRTTIKRAIDRQTASAELTALSGRLQVFMEEFSRLVCAGIVDLKVAGPATAAAICKGLGVLPLLADARLLSRQDEKALRAAVTQLTHVLAGVIAASDVQDRDATDATLTFLTWLSRGLKAGLLSRDDKTLRAAFDRALDQMTAWAAAPVPSGLDGYHLAACFVQLNTIHKFGLLPLDENGAIAKSSRERLQQVVESLCLALPNIFYASHAADGVQTTNVSNTIKDFIDAGLLAQQSHGWLMPVIAILLQRMERVPHNEMVGNGGQVLANCANFLRMLSETGLYLQPAFQPCVHGYHASCARLTGMVAENGFVLRGAVGQSLANLMSFIKAMARQEERSKAPAAPHAMPAKATQEQLNAATRRLMQLLEKVDFGKQSPESISGLLSALAYVWARRMAPAGQCGQLAQRLLAAIPAVGGARWEGATVALSLRAIVQLHGLGKEGRPGAKSAFLRLLDLLSRNPARDDTQRLHCLQALQLALLEHWTSIEHGTTQAALRGLLQWQGPTDPDVAQLQAAIASLAHREESPPAVLDTPVPAVAPMQPQPQPQPLPGNAPWSPPGGTLADAGSTSGPRKNDGRNATSITYRAPASLTTASAGTATSTTSSAQTARSANKARSGAAGKSVAAKAADPVTQWFTLASSAERGAGLIGQMTRLSSGRNAAMVNRTDEFGNSALYYAVVAGKPELVQWLLRHPAFTLGMSEEQAEDLMDRLEHNILSSINWDEAKQALALLGAEMRRVRPVEDSEKNEAQPASSSSSSSSSSVRKGKQARSVQKRGVEWKTDPEQRKTEWFRLARGNDSRKEAHRRMRELVEREPSLLSSVDESGFDALHYVIKSGRRQIEQWLCTLYARTGQSATLVKRMGEEFSTQPFAPASGDIDLDQVGGDARVAYLTKLLIQTKLGDLRLWEPAAGDKQTKAAPLSVAAQMAQAYDSNDVATVRRLLRTEEGKGWARSTKQADGDNLLVFSAIQGNVSMVEVLLELDDGALADQAAEGRSTALLMAASKGHLGVLKLLFKRDRGSTSLHQTRHGEYALLAAAESGHNDCVKFLLSWNGGSLADSLTRDNDSALIIAAREGHTEVVQTMIKRGDMDLLDHHNKKNCNALTVAAERGHAEIVTMLLNARSELAWAANDDMTPLLLAAQAGHADVVRAFLDFPQAISLAKCVVSARRLNALDLAEQNGHEEAAKVLREFNGGSLVRKPGE